MRGPTVAVCMRLMEKGAFDPLHRRGKRNPRPKLRKLRSQLLRLHREPFWPFLHPLEKRRRAMPRMPSAAAPAEKAATP